MPYIKPNLQPSQFAVFAISRMKNTTFEANTTTDGEGNTVTDLEHPVVKSEYINAYIPITFYDGERSSYFSIYDENLQQQENSQYSFTFSVAKYLNGELNPIFYLLVENRRLRLQTYYQKIDFIITGITPQITNQNIVYQVTCQDVFSYDLSKQNVAISFEPTTPLDIRSLGDEIMKLSKMDARWKIDPMLETGYYADFPALQQVQSGITKTPHRMKATMSISDSTPFNALVELAKKFNANLRAEYSDKEDQPGIIYFENKLLPTFKGYQLRPEVNLSAFSVSRKTDNFCSIMHVSGGEDADGNIVSMVPTIPVDVQKYFMMLYPHKTHNPHDIFKTSSYEYVVIENNNGTFTRYCKLGTTYVTDKTNYKPWTKMTAEEIRHDFNTFKFPDGSAFSTAYANEVNDYFNFLSYRAKTGASMFYDFNYYKDVGLMDEQTYQDLENKMSLDLRNANIILFCITYQYNILNVALQRYEDLEEEYFAQLAALEEEMYLYETGQLDTPETVLQVMGASEDQAGTLNKTTIVNVIANEKLSILNKLHTEVWVDEYYKLLFTLRGANCLSDKISDLSTGGLKKQESKFEENYNASLQLLNSKAVPGAISLQAASVTIGDGCEFVTAPLKTSRTLYVGASTQTFTHAAFVKDPAGPKFNIYLAGFAINGTSSGVYLLTYENAVINTALDGSSGTGTITDGDVAAHAELDDIVALASNPKKYASMTIKFYYNKSGTACTLDVFKPKACATRIDRETYLSNCDPSTYSNYAVYKKRYGDALQYITEYPSKTDPSSVAVTPVRRGLYQLQYDYWNDAINQVVTDPYRYHAAKEKYSTPYNLLEWLTDAQNTQTRVWEDIYTYYGDFIAETTFSDSDQISSEGLFMAAMQSFSKYNTPTYEYSTTVINSNAISNIQDKDVAIGDIVYVYNSDVSTQFANKLRITVPRADGLGMVYAKCKLFCDKQAEDRYYYPYDDEDGHGVYLSTAPIDGAVELTVHHIEPSDMYTDIIVNCDLLNAMGIMGTKASIDTITLYTWDGVSATSANQESIVSAKVLDIVMEEDVKPIPLQITGVTRKLREATSQLTVSTDRTMDLVFHRLIQQARL